MQLLQLAELPIIEIDRKEAQVSKEVKICRCVLTLSLKLECNMRSSV